MLFKMSLVVENMDENIWARLKSSDKVIESS